MSSLQVYKHSLMSGVNRVCNLMVGTHKSVKVSLNPGQSICRLLPRPLGVGKSEGKAGEI